MIIAEGHRLRELLRAWRTSRYPSALACHLLDPSGEQLARAKLLAGLVGSALLLGALVNGCAGSSNADCGGAVVPSTLVSDAALFRVDLYGALGCSSLTMTDAPVAVLSRTFPAGAQIVLDAPPGHYAVVVTSFSDASAMEPLGSACSDTILAAGAQLCLPLALAPVDLAGGVDPSDLGALDLAAVDLDHVAGTEVAHDDFQRPDQKSWGVASDGQSWGGSAGGANVFGIVGGLGQAASGGSATYPANLGPPVSDAEVLANGVIASSGGHWGAQLRNGGASTTYSAMLDGATLTVRRVVNGATVVLAMTNFTAATGTSYVIRFRVVGATLKARVWPVSGVEPTSWTLTTTDAAPLGPGFGGLRFSVPGSSAVDISSFSLVAL